MEVVQFIPTGQRRLLLMAAQAESAPVLICGASGTGRGAISRWIHMNGPRAAAPILTGSRDEPLTRQIAAAHEGTLVIPEIGEWPRGDQKILLDFIKTKAIPHPSSNGTKMLVNTRIIVTTSQALEGRAQGGLFNAELLKKINVFRIEMPPLVNRKDEFSDIVLGLMNEITRELHKEHIKDLSPPTWKALEDYEWPGNLRELRNVLRMAVVSAQGNLLELDDLPKLGSDEINFHATRAEFEKIYLTELLAAFDWQIDRACQTSRIDRDTLLKKIEKYGIQKRT